MIVEGIDLPDHLATEDAPRMLYRIHDARHSPVFFGTSGNYRFDAPHQSFGVLYAAYSPEGAFVEAVMRQDLARRKRIITRRFLACRKLSTLRLARTFAPVKLFGNGLALNHASAEVASGSPYTASQLYAQAVHEHPDKVDGIAYRCRHDDDQIAVALFERAKDLFDSVETPVHTLDQDASWLAELAARYNVIFD